MNREKDYFIVVNQAIVPAPYGMDSLYPGITLVHEKREEKFLESFHDKELALIFIEDVVSSVVFVENYEGTGSLHAVVKEFILFERNSPAKGKAKSDKFSADAEPIGYSKMPQKKGAVSCPTEVEVDSCPLCGGEAIIVESSRIENDYVSYGVACRICGCGIPLIYESEEEAAKAWNRRTGK